MSSIARCKSTCLPWPAYYADHTRRSVYAMVLIHFLKRELETLLYVAPSLHQRIPSVPSVHRFSHATMPLRNIFKKCARSFMCRRQHQLTIINQFCALPPPLRRPPRSRHLPPRLLRARRSRHLARQPHAPPRCVGYLDGTRLPLFAFRLMLHVLNTHNERPSSPSSPT